MNMKLGERIKKNQEYIKNVQITGGLNIVQTVYPQGWIVIPDTSGTISITRDDNGSVFYYSNIDNTTLDDLIDYIENTVSENHEIELKQQMLSQRIEELNELFEKNSIDKLSTLRFVFDQPKPKQTQKKQKGRKKKEQATEPVVLVNDGIEIEEGDTLS